MAVASAQSSDNSRKSSIRPRVDDSPHRAGVRTNHEIIARQQIHYILFYLPPQPHAGRGNAAEADHQFCLKHYVADHLFYRYTTLGSDIRERHSLQMLVGFRLDAGPHEAVQSSQSRRFLHVFDQRCFRIRIGKTGDHIFWPPLVKPAWQCAKRSPGTCGVRVGLKRYVDPVAPCALDRLHDLFDISCVFRGCAVMLDV